MLAALFGGAMSVAGTATAAVNLVANGGFENPLLTAVLPQGYYTIGAGAHTVPLDFDWSVPVNNVDVVTYAGPYGGGNSQPPGGGGRQFLDLVGNGSTGAISQNVNLVAGKKYDLTFYYANNPYSTSTASGDLTVGVGDLTTSITHDTSTTSNFHWTKGYYDFTAGSSGPQQLEFMETVGGGSGGIFLDNIVLNAVPEPATWLSLIAGLFATGWFLRRQRAQSADGSAFA
jgi:hypothetical protein